jgi:DNA-binding response OmpR family regulator
MNHISLQKLNLSSSAPVVAVVEDDSMLREELEFHLSNHNFKVHSVNSGAALDDLVARQHIDLFVLDLNLPGENGLSISRRMRQLLPNVGIVIVTARTTLQDRLSGYSQGGADFYLGKPVAPDELVLVLNSLARRVLEQTDDTDWLMNVRDRTLTGPRADQKLRLTHREKALLVALVQAKNNTLDSDSLRDVLMGDESDSYVMSKHALEELVARLRKKFRTVQEADAEPAIKSAWGVGYQLCIPIRVASYRAAGI